MNDPRRPSLSELRGRVQKGRHREIGNWLARRVARPTAIYGTWLAVRLGLSAHQVTLAALAVVIGSALAIGTGTPVGFVAGVALAHLAFWLDHVDGQVARWHRRPSLEGVFFDYLLHHAWNLSLGFSLGLALAVRSGDVLWSVAGFLIATGWIGLSLINDCKYKAFFQRLKAGEGAYVVETGAGGRPAPPPGWPRTGRAMFTWPAYKACEPHVVLIALTAAVPLALLAPETWHISLCWGVRAMALLAPSLALGRAVRLIVRGGVTTEFDRWFQPMPRGPHSRTLNRWTSESPPSSLADTT